MTARPAPPSRRNPYSVHPGVKMVQNWIESLEAKTGRTLAAWIAVSKKDGPKDEAGLRKWLKDRHGLGTNLASWMAEKVFGTARGFSEGDPKIYLASAPKLVDAQFQGKKAALRPLYDALLSDALSISPDVRACPCETVVPLYRTHVFAQLKATTNTRLDLGLALGAYKGALPARLVDTGGALKKDRITHRVEITKAADIGPFTARWLRVAYDLDFKPLKGSAKAEIPAPEPKKAVERAKPKELRAKSGKAGGRRG